MSAAPFIPPPAAAPAGGCAAVGSTARGSAAVAGPGVHGGDLAGLIESLHGLLDRMGSEAARPTAVSSVDVQQVERALRRLEAVKLTLIGKADRQDVHKRTGDTSTTSWLSTTTRSGGGAAAKDVALATALEESLPETREALGAGEVSSDCAAIIAGAMKKLPETLTDAERARIETALVRDAKRLDPARLRKAATMALAAAQKSAEEVAQHAEDQLLDEETRAYKASQFTLHDRGDGTSTGRFTVPTGVAQILRKVLHSMTAPRRDHHKTTTTGSDSGSDSGSGSGSGGSGGQGSLGGAGRGAAFGLTPDQGAAGGSAGEADLFSTTADENAGTGTSDDAGVGEDLGDCFITDTAPSRNDDWAGLGWAEKRGRAFVDLLEHLNTERLHGKVAASMVITMPLDQLLGAAKAAELAQATGTKTGPSIGPVPSDTGHLHSTATARRLACNAALIPAVLGGTSLPLDLGRQDRLFTEAQRLALATVYDECAATGCDRPYAWSELHHQHPWATGGRTDLKDAIPLCGAHHRLIHNDHIPHRITTDPSGKKTAYFGQRC